jgi:hypothetical protein
MAAMHRAMCYAITTPKWGVILAPKGEWCGDPTHEFQITGVADASCTQYEDTACAILAALVPWIDVQFLGRYLAFCGSSQHLLSKCFPPQCLHGLKFLFFRSSSLLDESFFIRQSLAIFPGFLQLRNIPLNLPAVALCWIVYIPYK